MIKLMAMCIIPKRIAHCQFTNLPVNTVDIAKWDPSHKMDTSSEPWSQDATNVMRWCWWVTTWDGFNLKNRSTQPI
jgi:hypothetical protein